MTVGRAKWGCLGLVIWVVWSVLGGVALAEDLSETAQAKQYQRRATRALKAKDPQRAIRALKELETVTSERRWEFLYVYGTLLVEYGATAAEVEKGKNELVKAVNKIEKMGKAEDPYYEPYYVQALDRLDMLKEKEDDAFDRAGFRNPWGSMVHVQGGTFRMGCTAEQRDCDDDEEPVHRVRVSDFEISQYEVTQALWETVMGEDPSGFEGCGQCPVESVSWDDVQMFLKKLNELTGEEYRLPTEAEWEYAARGGQRSRGYQYAGSETLDVVAWYDATSGGKTHPVGQKEPNELGLYDMSGNVLEWTQDCWNDNYRGAPSDGRAWESGNCEQRVLRGGSWSDKPGGFRSAFRLMDLTGNRYGNVGFRLARTLLEIQMVHVQGGTFRMGCTAEQRDCDDDEEPVHRVRVSDFEISQYEVTQALWETVMGEDPSGFEGCGQCPVESVSWDDVQMFLKKLNELTGEEYRLPTEAEWEYAARGGQRSRGYQYAGSETLDVVAWYDATSGGKTHPVGQKEPNELGLYDMSGNVLEWTQDCWNDNYRGAPSDGRAWESGNCEQRVLRGGSWYDSPRFLRSALRFGGTAGNRDNSYGFRLARTLTP